MRRPRFHGHESGGRAVLCSGSRAGSTGVGPVVPGCAVTVRDHPGREPRGENRCVHGVQGVSDSGRFKEAHLGTTTGDVSKPRGLGFGNSPNPARVA